MATEYKYIKFYSPWFTSEKRTLIESFWILVLELFNWLFVPIENPDFDKKFEDVTEWFLEIDSQTNKPNREIGTDITGKTIVKMPWLNNKGFWSSGLLISRQNPVEITQSAFEKRWNEFFELPNKN